MWKPALNSRGPPIWFQFTFQGLPGSNSGTKSVNAAAGDCWDDGQSLFSLSGVESGQPSLILRPEDHVLMFEQSASFSFVVGSSFNSTKKTYPSCRPSDPITEFVVDIVDLEVVPGAREKSVVLSPPSLSKFGNFHWFKRDCWPPEFWKLFGGSYKNRWQKKYPEY